MPMPPPRDLELHLDDPEVALQIFHSGDSRPDIPCLPAADLPGGSPPCGHAPPRPRPHPRPLLKVETAFETEDGQLIQFIGERWRNADAWAAEVDLERDPTRPSECFGFRFVDCVTGRVYAPLTQRELERKLEDRKRRRQARRPRPGPSA